MKIIPARFLALAVLSLVALLSSNLALAADAPSVPARKKLLYIIEIFPDPVAVVAKLKAGGTRTVRLKEIPAYHNDHPKMLAHLASLGFDVTVSYDDTPVDELIKGQDLVMISEEVSATHMGEKFRFVKVPVICLESDLYDDMRMTGLNINTDYGEYISERIQQAAGHPDPAGNPAPQRFIYLVNAPHPMAGGLRPGIIQLLESHEEMNWGLPGPGATIIATIAGEPKKIAIFGYEKGATMEGENIAPARRVGFALRTFSGLAPDGVKLFDAALKWASESPAN
ncbi:MAG: hypothetical protein JWM88_882 [Verrucomicrobia bacterium]|nr:hypothetical protein [Verrucomicrobiota bacterium]